MKRPDRAIVYVNLGVATLSLVAFATMLVVQSCAMRTIGRDADEARAVMFERVDRMEAKVEALAQDVEALGESVDATHEALNELDDTTADAIKDLRRVVMKLNGNGGP